MNQLGIIGSAMVASLGWYQISTRNREYILIGAAVAVVILAALSWAVFIRKRDRHGGDHLHQHDGSHRRRRRRRHHRSGGPTDNETRMESGKQQSERRRHKHRHKHRREEDRRNPTRAETGGLPGRRDADMAA